MGKRNPILLVHGFAAASRRSTSAAVTGIYGPLVGELRRRYGKWSVRDLNVSRYVSLDDGINLDDLARGLDRALRHDFSPMLADRFDVITHSLGALVVRNWLRRYSRRPSPIERLIYLAGANFGSGWAHVGRGQLAKWGRAVFQGGAERGLQLLSALELGSTEVLDLHRFFLDPQADLQSAYRVREFCLVGSQVLPAWLPIPVRYAHEDGSDGAVRVAGSNPNWNYLRIEPKRRAELLEWQEVAASCSRLMTPPNTRRKESDAYYRVAQQVFAAEREGGRVPLAIPYECAHSGDERGILTGRAVRDEVLSLLDIALDVGTTGQYRKAANLFAEHSALNYRRVSTELSPRRVGGLWNEPRAQYDPHAQLIFRVVDQYGVPVEHVDVLIHGTDKRRASINELFEHTHENLQTPGILNFYLRTAKFDPSEGDWIDQLRRVGDVHLEISALEPRSDKVRYLPMCLPVSARRLRRWVRDHTTTVFDVVLLRLPSPVTFQIVPAAWESR